VFNALSSVGALNGLQPPAATPRQSILTSAAGALGLSVAGVRSALQGGQSLADLAQQQGVPTDSVVAAVAQGLQSITGGTATSDNVASAAQSIVDRKGLGGQHHRHHHPAVQGDSSTDPFASAGTYAGDASSSAPVQGLTLDTTA
jgi:hypothetical protein